MDYANFKKLLAFFSALKDVGFRRTLQEIPSFTIIGEQRVPVDKAKSLELLRLLPEFQGDDFKDNNNIIKYLSDPRNRERIKAKFSRQQQKELTKTLEETPIATEVVGEQPVAETGAGAPAPIGGAQTAGGVPSLGGMPTGGTSYAPRRVIHEVPRAPETPKPEIHITTSSEAFKEAGDPSKLVRATSSGKIVEAPPKQIFIANKTGVYNIQAPSWSKTFGSNAQIFAKQNFSRVTSGLGNIAKGVGRGLGGVAGGGGRFLGRAALTGSDAMAGISTQMSRGSLIKTPAKKWLIGGFLIMVLGVALIGATAPQTSQTSPGGSSSDLLSSAGLNYTLPLKDTTIQPLDIKDQVRGAFPGAKLEYWDKIIRSSQTSGFNPALALTLWIEETGASQATLIKNGGSEILTNGSLSKGHLGCAPWEDQTIDESLTCLFKSVATNNFTNDQFINFMIIYGGGTPGQSLVGNENFPKFPNGVKDWYKRLVPLGPGAIQETNAPISASEPSGCPTAGNIATPYGFNIATYPDVANEGCGGLPKCHNGIDISAPVGFTVRSTLNGVVSAAGSDPSLKGNFVEIYNQESGITVTYEHLSNRLVDQGANISKGTTIGTVGTSGAVTGPTLHYKIRKGSALLNPFRFIKDSAAISDKSLTQEDSIAANDYAKVDNPSDVWGLCQ